MIPSSQFANRPSVVNRDTGATPREGNEAQLSKDLQQQLQAAHGNRMPGNPAIRALIERGTLPTNGRNLREAASHLLENGHEHAFKELVTKVNPELAQQSLKVLPVRSPTALATLAACREHCPFLQGVVVYGFPSDDDAWNQALGSLARSLAKEGEPLRVTFLGPISDKAISSIEQAFSHTQNVEVHLCVSPDTDSDEVKRLVREHPKVRVKINDETINLPSFDDLLRSPPES